MKTFEGEIRGRRRRVAIIAARFNGVVVERLVEGAEGCFRKFEVADDEVDLIWVPGCFELPLVAGRLAAGGDYDAVICLGAVIRGETAHFEYVADAAATGIREAGQRTGVPVIFGVLTTDTLAQAMDRAGGSYGNKGWDAALAGLEMAGLLETLPKEVPG